jgi:uncharacterized protein
LPKSPRLYSWLLFARKPHLGRPVESPVESVIDTNVLLDWLVFRDPRVAPLVAAIEAGRLQWIASPAMLDELAHVQLKPQLQSWLPAPGSLTEAAARWRRVVDGPAPGRPTLICTDTDDQKFIDLALARRTPWLLSRDRALLALARRARPHGITICPPEAWRESTAARS